MSVRIVAKPGAWRLGPEHPDYEYSGIYGYPVIAPGASPPRAKRPSRWAGGKNGPTMARRFFLTAEGRAAMTSADSAWSEPAACAQNIVVRPSAHSLCPSVLGCREGRIPEGWVPCQS
jgi:hypothetical protein